MMRPMDDIAYRWRGALTDAEMVELVMAHGTESSRLRAAPHSS